MVLVAIDLTTIRSQIAQILIDLPGVKRVHEYERSDDEANMPFITVWRGEVARPDPDSAEPELYRRRYEIDWIIRLYSVVSDQADAQKYHDDALEYLILQFDEQPLLDADAGLVDYCRVVSADTVVVPGSTTDGRSTRMLTEATLTTISEI